MAPAVHDVPVMWSGCVSDRFGPTCELSRTEHVSELRLAYPASAGLAVQLDGMPASASEGARPGILYRPLEGLTGPVCPLLEGDVDRDGMAGGERRELREIDRLIEILPCGRDA